MSQPQRERHRDGGFVSRFERLIGSHKKKLYHIVLVSLSVSRRLLCSCQTCAIIWQLSDLFKREKNLFLSVSRVHSDVLYQILPVWIWRVHLISVRAPKPVFNFPNGGEKSKNKQKKNPPPENQRKYRTFEMPKDSRTHRLLDNSLQATITPQSISPTPSLSLSHSLSSTPLSLCQFAFLSRVLLCSHSR